MNPDAALLFKTLATLAHRCAAVHGRRRAPLVRLRTGVPVDRGNDRREKLLARLEKIVRA